MNIQYSDNEYIKLFRKMINWEWYTDVNTKVLFLHCLLKANWKPGDWKGIHYERGQFITSLNTLAAECGLSVKMVRTALEHLISTGEIVSQRQDKGTTKCRIITVINYDDYQDTGKTKASEGQDKGKTGARQGQQYKNIKNNKELKNNIGEPVRYFPDNDVLEETFNEFRKMRNTIKKPMTDRAIELMIKKLERMTADPLKKQKILEQSITHCWQDIYELKNEAAAQKKPQNMFNSFPQRELDEEYFANLERKKLAGR